MRTTLITPSKPVSGRRVSPNIWLARRAKKPSAMLNDAGMWERWDAEPPNCEWKAPA